MKNYIFKQLKFVRENTIRHVANMNDETSLFIPVGFNNNIKWNLGHIYAVQERFAFDIIGEKMTMPNHFTELFSTGTKPSEWGEQKSPAIYDLIQLLDNQVNRVEQALEFRLNTTLEQPYTTSTGLTLSSVEELLTFCLYHEGMHFGAIKSISQMFQDGDKK
ncbi:DinB family protein [Peribacillus butanolivorans]|uniref:DinB family protein n=1 Tax=Peribacillus butanolivorans TaxID=421767 RepID=UPI00207D69B7|nr:DinB family protein [Peribacillus butanolivorans]MCO0597018.1 DinB family protein [Peribacillus butanolivorans]